MSRSYLLSALIALSLGSAHADELVKSVQGVLKDQGFFYGEVTGASGPETSAAVKRYQIRNGLEVTGTLTKETLEALGVTGGEPAPVEPAPPLQPPPPQRAAPVERERTPAARPPVDLRREPTTDEKDREFLRRDTPRSTQPPPDEAMRRPPGRVAGGPYADVFAQSPYASAPAEVQVDTIRRAQRFLRELSFYRDEVDGRPGPALEEGILGYQRFIALPLTGKLDLETLAAMRLLPGRGGAPSQAANPKVRTMPGRPLKGVWIK